MKDFHKLLVWKKAHGLTLAVYHASSLFPDHERYGLTSQLQRASASIAANLAEGCGRESDGDFRRFVEIASGSACEVEYHLLLARDLNMLGEHVYQRLDRDVNEVTRMLAALARRLRTTQPKRPNQTNPIRSFDLKKLKANS
jgi:four helix bundle protein